MNPRPGVLLESLLDLLDNLEQPVFLRVLALRLLEEVSKGHKSIALDQWLQAPNGLHRVADLLAIDVENQPMEEKVYIRIFNKISHCISHIDRFSLLGSVRLNHHILMARRSDFSNQIFLIYIS